MTEEKRPIGRPKKAEADKAKYQLVAIYKGDYLELKRKIGKYQNDKKKIADVLGKFIQTYEPERK